MIYHVVPDITDREQQELLLRIEKIATITAFDVDTKKIIYFEIPENEVFWFELWRRDF